MHAYTNATIVMSKFGKIILPPFKVLTSKNFKNTVYWIYMKEKTGILNRVGHVQYKN